MKKTGIYITLFWFFGPLELLACELCEQHQPKMLRDITHGTGPNGGIDYVIIWSAVIIVAVTLLLSIKYLIRPKESSPDHIKNITIHK